MTTAAGSIQENRVHHIVITYESTSQATTVFVDTVLLDSQVISNGIAGNFYIFIGRNSNLYLDEFYFTRLLYSASLVSNRFNALGFFPPQLSFLKLISS